jgi:hypothetical protein
MIIAGRVVVCLSLALALAALNLPLTFASPQGPTATLNGRVVDPNKALVAGAKVDATNEDTNVTSSTETNAEGLFVLPNLPIGRYRISVQKQGFQTIVKPDVDLHVQDQVSLNFTMDVGSVVQSLTVEAGAPLIQNESAAVGTLVDRQFVENLPLPGRSFQGLFGLTPGVVLSKPNPTGGQFSVNGQRADSNNFSIDGVSANNGIGPANNFGQATTGTAAGLSVFGGTSGLISVDALQEFKIQTSTYAPEFGRNPGAQVSIVSRSGTNEFHGTAFDYFRNDVLDSNDWFANRGGAPKPPLRQNDFGGVVGGPILKNRTFFFLSYEGLRVRQPLFTISEVPSLTVRQGAPLEIRPLLNAFPLPNGPLELDPVHHALDGFAEFSASYSNPSTLDAGSVRVDHKAKDNLTVFGRYNIAPSESIAHDTANLSGLISTYTRTWTLTGGATWTATPTLVNEFRMNFSGTKATSSEGLSNSFGAQPPADSSVFPAFASRADSHFSLELLFPSNTSLGLGNLVQNVQRQFNLVDNVAMVRGSHQVKLGVDFRRLAPTLGPFKYSQDVQFNALASLNAKTADAATITAKESAHPTFINFSAFAQDTWSINRRTVLTYGVRWEVNPAPSDRTGNPPLTLAGLSNPSTLQLAPPGTSLYSTRWSNFAPRIGVSFQLSQRPGLETVLRGGVGIFYDVGSDQDALGYGQFPFSAVKSLSSVPYPLASGSAAPPPFPNAANPAFPIGLVVAFDPSLKLPRSYQWSAAIEQSLGSNQILSITYVGSAGRNLLQTERLTNPNPRFGAVVVIDSVATSDYDALQLQFRRRLSRGLQVLASYSWSHALDDASTDSTEVDHARGASDFDVRHAFSAGFTYNLPAPKGPGFAGKLLRNWGIDGIVRAQTARPIDIIARSSVGLGGLITNIRPDLIGGVPIYLDDPTAPGGQRLNPAAFAVPPTGPSARQGTLGRNAIRGFPFSQADLSLRRQFPIAERITLQFRVDAFNLTNHPNFGDPINTLTIGNTTNLNPRFGLATQMLGQSLFAGGAAGGGFNPLYQVGGPRSIQVSLKALF